MREHGDHPAGLLELPAAVVKADERGASLDLSGGERRRRRTPHRPRLDRWRDRGVDHVRRPQRHTSGSRFETRPEKSTEPPNALRIERGGALLTVNRRVVGREPDRALLFGSAPPGLVPRPHRLAFLPPGHIAFDDLSRSWAPPAVSTAAWWNRTPLIAGQDRSRLSRGKSVRV